MFTSCLHLFVFLSLAYSLQIYQEAIDIFEGVRDDQALRMAANLGFKGALQRQVMGPWKALKSQRRISDSDIHIYVGRQMLAHS